MAEDARGRRFAHNESAFHAVYERSDELAVLLGIENEFVCECDRPDCNRRLQVPASEYEWVRASGERFIVAPGHVRTAAERIVEEGRGWLVVENLAEADEAVPTRGVRDDL
jgi:hypothetical protein